MNRQTIFKYQGYMMRSHSETRWAEMMDALGIQWIYEPQLVKTRHGWYLPDFYLPGAGVYLEVKGPEPTRLEIDKARDLQSVTKCPVIFAWGDMRLEGEEVCGAYINALRNWGEPLYTMHEMGEIVRGALGQPYNSRFMHAGLKREGPSCSRIGDLIEEVLFDIQPRADKERAKAEHHSALNKPKLNEHRQLSKAEWAMSLLLRRPDKSAVAA